MFIQPVSMKIPSQEDYERDLKQQLLKLGYTETDYEWENTSPYLITGWYWHNTDKKEMGFNQKHSANDSTYKIDTYNPQLFLALAGLTDDPIKVGDWLMSLDTSIDYHEGNLYQVDTYDGECITSLQSCPTKGAKKRIIRSLGKGEKLHFRKATGGEVMQHFSNVVVETVSLAEKLLTQIPKYFVVKRDDSPKWDEYIEWLNKTYAQNWGGKEYRYYGYHGANTKNGYDYKGMAGYDNVEDFKNNPQVFESAEEFMKLINQQSKMKRILKRDDFKAILNTISPECRWHQDLINKFKDFAIKDELEVPDELYVRGRKAANDYQTVLLDKIFGKDTKDVDLSKRSNDDLVNFLSIRKGGNYDSKGFFLSPAFKWEITTDSQGEKVLVPTYR